MAPKKNENKTAAPKTKKGKATKTPIKKNSPKFKKEIIKVKVPAKNLKKTSSNDPPDGPDVTKIDAKRILTFDRMNEVARAQLVKDSTVLVEVTEPVVKKKRGRKKKIDEPEPVEVVPKKKLKGPAKVQAKGVKAPKVTAPNRTLAKRVRGRPPLRGKLVTDEDLTITSPSILSQLTGCKTPVKDPEKTVMKSPVSVPKNDANSRRTSVTSVSEWSWTKDISRSSTTTCFTVRSTDIVRIDGKVPKIQLSKIDHMLNREPLETKSENKELENSLSEDSSSTSSSSSSSSSSDSSTVQNCLNLSTSSISHCPLSPTYTPMEQSFEKSKLDKMDFDEIGKQLEMLAPKLESFKLRFQDFGNENETLDMKPLEEKVFKVLEEEYKTVVECNFVYQMLSQTSFVHETSAPEIEEPIGEPDFAKPDVSLISNVNLNKTCDNHNDFSCECPRRRDSYVSYDDDDALSLFAESLTGMSSRLSTVASVTYAPPTNEKYVPQPIGKTFQNTVTYQPTKISNLVVCEKQNADSTSIHKEPELVTVVTDKMAHLTSLNPDKPLIAEQRDLKRNNPPLTITSYQRPHGTKSMTLTGVCFFHLTNTCNKNKCLYPHRMIEEAEFKQKLRQLSEKEFFREYMVIGKWQSLKRRYIKCFVDECQRRELPKILVEMVIEFMSKLPQFTADESDICLSILESTLSYLNAWDLSVCEKLLEYNVNGKVLCDMFMVVIGNTQNFSQFKHVFIKLTEFMVQVNRTFNFEVVSHILERVCILPYEGPLSASALLMIERTDRKIFDTKMMSIFEQQLSNFNNELYEKLLALKEKNPMNECSRPVSEHSHSSSLQSTGWNKKLEPSIINPSATEIVQRYTSPDTTNTDNMSKPPVNDPVIIRTFNNLRPNMSQNQNRSMHHMRPNVNTRPNPNHSMIPPNMNRMMRPNMCQPQQGPMYPHNGYQRMQTPRMQRPQKRPMGRPGPCGPPYENHSKPKKSKDSQEKNKYQRRFGPNFYGNH